MKRNDTEFLMEAKEVINNFSPSLEGAKEADRRMKEYSIENLDKYLLKAKKDNYYWKEVAESLIYMYSKDSPVYVCVTNNVIHPVKVNNKLCMPIYSKKSLIDQVFENKTTLMGTKKAFELFYKASDKNIIDGIIFNPNTIGELAALKDTIDLLYLDLFFDVPWTMKKEKKKIEEDLRSELSQAILNARKTHIYEDANYPFVIIDKMYKEDEWLIVPTFHDDNKKIKIKLTPMPEHENLGQFLVVNTEPKYFCNVFGTDMTYLSIRKILDQMNAFGENCAGILCNPATESEAIFFKESLQKIIDFYN